MEQINSQNHKKRETAFNIYLYRPTYTEDGWKSYRTARNRTERSKNFTKKGYIITVAIGYQ